MSSVAVSRAGRREWIGLAVLSLACVLYAMDVTVLHLAVPSMTEDLRPSSSQLLWIVDVYGFLVAGSLITMGTLGDRIGRRRLLLIGAGAFGVASVLAAFSNSAEMLIAARALLGVAGATLAPSTLSLIRSMFLDQQQRTTAIGVWVASFSVGGAIGPLAGGLLLEHFWWGSVFLMAVPVMVLLVAVGPVLLPEYRDPRPGRLDIPSAALSLGSVMGVIYGFKQIAQDGLNWSPGLAIVAGVIIGCLFIARQRTLVDPFVDLTLFRLPGFSASLATYTLSVFISFGLVLFIAQYLQLVLGLSPLQAGLWTLPQSAAFVIGSTFSPAIVRRVRPAFVIAGGLSLAALGFGMVTRSGGESSMAFVVIGSALFSLGLTPAITLATDLVVGAAPPERAGAASAISETGAEFGGALSIAIFGSLGTAIYRSALSGAIPAGVSPEAAQAARDTLGGALSVAGQLPEPLGVALLDAARGAFIHALDMNATISALAAAGMAIMVVVLLRQMGRGSEPEAG